MAAVSALPPVPRRCCRPEVDTAIDPVGLHHQFTLHAVIPAPGTILKGVRKLAPGHCLTIDIQTGCMSKATGGFRLPPGNTGQ